MNVRKVGDCLRASLITGPTHNLLGLAISGVVQQDSALEVVDLRPNDDTPTRIQAHEVQEWVMDAVAEFAKSNDCQIMIARIEYCRDDTPSPGYYHRLVNRILGHYLQNASDE